VQVSVHCPCRYQADRQTISVELALAIDFVSYRAAAGDEPQQDHPLQHRRLPARRELDLLVAFYETRLDCYIP
jgi:hypothetical protein